MEKPLEETLIMPVVDGKKYSYTRQGRAAARDARKKKEKKVKGNMSDKEYEIFLRMLKN